MRLTRRNQIELVIAGLEEQMRALVQMGLPESASLVRIAWLDLRCRNDRISKQELKVLCDRITNTVDDPDDLSLVRKMRRRRPTTRSRPKASAHIIDLGAWRARLPHSR